MLASSERMSDAFKGFIAHRPTLHTGRGCKDVKKNEVERAVVPEYNLVGHHL